MNALLIHNDNLPGSLIDGFTNNLTFSIAKSKILEEGFSFDKEAHNQLGKTLNNEKPFNVIFLPFSLSDNYLELTGLRLALHIRLTPQWRHTRVPIVFIGNETPEQIAKLSNLGNILLTTGVFSTSKFDIDSIQKQYEWIVNEWRPTEKAILSEDDYKIFLNKIKIAPPVNYESHHSIDNELTLLRWSEYIGYANKIQEVKENLQTGLYFKYIRALNPIPTIADNNKYLIQGKAKILLIDDEVEKGWKGFYTSFLKNSPSISFDNLDINFKSLSSENIIGEGIKKVKEYDPDIVLLDLRLHDSDFLKETKPKEITGYKVLQEIKNINQGIQVIITTASNKVWNYELLFEAGANWYIVKNGNSNVAEDITNLKLQIEHSIKKANTLKKFYPSIIEIKSHIENNPLFNSEEDTLRKKIFIDYDIAFELLEKGVNSKDKKEYLNYAYLQLFQIIEEFLKIKNVFEYGDKCYVNKNIKVSEKISNSKWKSIIEYQNNNPSYWNYNENEDVKSINTDFKMSTVLVFLFDKENSNCLNWPKIRDVRNGAAHTNKRIVKENEIENLLTFQKYIFNKEKKEPTNKEGLTDEISTENIKELKEKFNH